MTADDNALYSAFMARDARFDGLFYVGVASTGIYCRPVCRTRRPKRENCTFYPTAAQAEQAGYRPCLLCRPELAPGFSRADATASLAYRAAQMLEQECGSGQGLASIAARLGCTDRHLRRVFKAEYSVSPLEYLQTCRLLLAKNLLTDTDLSVLDVAMAAGFGSLRRFNDAFKQNYRLAPTALRRQKPTGGRAGSAVTLTLSYRPPYRWQAMLDFLQARTIPAVELVTEGEYLRTVRLPSASQGLVSGWVRVADSPKQSALALTVSESLLPLLPLVIARIRNLFDLNCDPDAVHDRLKVMNGIRPGLCVLGTRVPGCFDAFEMSVRAVLGQQVTVKAARTLATRVTQAYGLAVETGIEGLTHAFPSPEDILAMAGDITDNFGKLGVTAARSQTILELARALAAGELDLSATAQPEDEIAKLTAIRGIGNWTAGYIAMRTMDWPDAFLETDAGIKRALEPCTPKELLSMAEAWRPWRSYATVNLWNSLDAG